MRIITIRGKYGYKPSETEQGLVALCQFESADSSKELEKAAYSLNKLAKQDRIIIVPFSHITNDVKEFGEAKDLFIKFSQSCREKSKGNVYVAPFGTPKALQLNASEDAEIKLLSFSAIKKRRIRNLYSINADTYEKHMQQSGHYHAQKVLIEKLQKFLKEPLIDIGAGTGFLAGQIIKYIKEIYLNDFSTEMLNKAILRLKDKRVFYSSFDAENPSINIKFNTIVCCNLFFYLGNRKKVIENWGKLLTNTGVIILLEEFPFMYTSKKELEGFNLGLQSVIQPIAPTEIVSLFEEQSFIKIKMMHTEIDARHNLFGYVFRKNHL